MIEMKKTVDVSDGDVVGRDIYLGGTLLLAKGTVIKPHLIHRLKRFGISEVPIQIGMPAQSEVPLQQETAVKFEGPEVRIQPIFFQLHKLIEAQSKKRLNAREQHLSDLFFQGMRKIARESRYGLAFNHSERLAYAYELWQSILADDHYYQTMMDLQKWDLPTYYHSLDTFILGTLFVKHIGMDNEHHFAAACLLHDIGKLHVPRKILASEDALSAEEFEIIKMHVDYGVQQLAAHDPDSPIIPIIEQHHERMDGSGYPEGRIGNQINLFSRLLMIIDVYSALTLERPYRDPLPSAKALEVMLHESHLYDPYFLREFMQMLHIYPVNATLELTNHKVVIVTDVTSHFPYLPTVTEKDQGHTYPIPNNLSISVRRLLSWEGVKETKRPDRFVLEELQHQFQNHLLLGEAGKAVSLIQTLTRTMPHETIIFHVIVHTVKQIQNMRQLGALKREDYQTACQICREVMDHFQSVQRLSDERFTILIAPSPSNDESVQLLLKIVNEALVLSGWRTIPLDTFPAADELLHYARSQHVRYVCVVPAYQADMSRLADTFKLMKQKSKMVLAVCTDFMDAAEIQQHDSVLRHADFYADLPALIERLRLYESIYQGLTRYSG